MCQIVLIRVYTSSDKFSDNRVLWNCRLITKANNSLHELSKDIENPNVVKVVCDENNNAINFSRIPNPEPRITNYKHIGVYVFRRKVLFEFVKLPESKMEKIEKLEQLRFLENGYKIRMVLTSYKGIGIDTPQDLEKAEKLLLK